MPQDNKAYAKREKAYMQGKLFPNIRVGMTKVNLTPTVVKDKNGIPHTEPNAPVYSYDTSGPFSDPNIEIDLKKCDHRTWFRAMQNYVRATYGFDVDEKCGNESRTCFLPHDSSCYVHPSILQEPDVCPF